MQRHALPSERQCEFVRVAGDHDRMQDGVQQSRMHTEPTDSPGRLRQPHLANISSPRAHIAVSPRNAGPYR
ncbi:Uncharacterised protein [Mycobacterium tuberculosis]|nr:Uncharacterised protein [Mycobacterium tuberculosis]